MFKLTYRVWLTGIILVAMAIIAIAVFGTGAGDTDTDITRIRVTGTGNELVFTKVIIDPSGPDSLWGKSYGDLDNDGDPDLIAGGHGGGGLVWYENPSWTKQVINSDSFSTDHELCDIDRDGDRDLVSIRDGGLVWFSNPSWTAQVITADVLHDIEVYDFDGDLDCDVVGRDQYDSGDVLYSYEQVAPTSWTRTTRDIPGGEGLKAIDLDADGDYDVITNKNWYENNGGPVVSWPQHMFSTAWNHDDSYIDAGDIDGDGDIDVVYTPSEAEGQLDKISWFEAPADPTTTPWTEHVVDTNVEAVHHFVGLGDFDRDGDTDIATAEMQQGANPDDVSIYVNENGIGTAWSETVIDTGGSHSMRVLDVDGDGDLDLFGANHADNEVHLFRNDTPPAVLALDRWERHLIDPSRPGVAVFVLPGDLSGDGLPDVAAGGYWYENPGIPGGNWTRRFIGSPITDVVAGEHNLNAPSSARALVFENADGAGTSWTQHDIYTGDEHHDGMQLVDIDRDGDLDVVSVGWDHNRVLLYENRATTD